MKPPGMLLRRALQIRAFFGEDCPFDGTDLQANATVNTGRKVDPEPIGAFGVFTGTGMNTGDRTGIHAISNAFTNVGNNRMGHGKFSTG
jgi:hypothetical protein